MAYTLDSTTIRAPYSIKETSTTQYAQQKTLQGTVGRDYFGDSKRVWVLEYRNTKVSDYNTIKTIYDAHITSGVTKNFVSTESNYAVSSTPCHVDLQVREFSVRGSDYLSDFTLILTEA